MKLKNKKTGEIPDKIETIAYIQWSKKIMMVYINNDGERIIKQYDSLKTFNAEWEDYEEPEEYYFIADFGGICARNKGEFPEDEEDRKQIGNRFESKEEAEKVVEKLEAWKRLKDKGFRFGRWQFLGDKSGIWVRGNLVPDIVDELDILFGGEE